MEKQRIKDGIFHTHTEESVKESLMQMEELFQAAKEMGAPAVVITDTNSLGGWVQAVGFAKQYGIKAVVGTEITLEWDVGEETVEGQILLIPQDVQGYTALCKLFFAMGPEKQTVDKAILERNFGSGSAGHGHILASTAGVKGLLCQLLLQDYFLEEEMHRAEKAMERLCRPDAPAYLRAKEKAKEIERNLLDCLGKHSDKISEESKQLVAKLSLQQKEWNVKLRKYEAEIAKWKQNQQLVQTYKKRILPFEKRYQQAVDMCREWSRIFGDNQVYLELQYHGLNEEAYVMPVLASLHQYAPVRFIASNHAHYTTNSASDLRRQKLLKTICGEKGVRRAPDEGTYYIRDDRELSGALLDILPDDIVSQAMEGIGKLVFHCRAAEIPSGKHYPQYPDEDAAAHLTKLAREGLKKRYPNRTAWTEQHENRLNYELKTIIEQGFAGLFCVVEDCIRFARQEGRKNPEGVGYVVGPGRGSAAGSLVCYLLEITAIDPLVHGLLFERFLSSGRITLPDIDTDYACEVRNKVVEYVGKKYGERAICGIRTRNRITARLALEYAGKANNTSEKLMQAIKRNLSGTGLMLKNEKDFCKKYPAACRTLEDAKLLENRLVGTGQHPAGILFSDTDDISDHLPVLFNDNSGKWLSQYDMTEVEQTGVLKVDFLELKTLDILSSALRILKRQGIEIDLEHLPQDPDVFQKVFSTGQTTAIFQFESSGMRQLLQQFRPQTIEDLILILSIHRPGPMQYVQSIVKARNKSQRSAWSTPKLKEILKDTYGYPVYQESIMRIFHEIAGVSIQEADQVRRAISKKKMDVLLDPQKDYRNRLINGLIQDGAARKQAEDFWVQLLNFGRYAFSKSHAAVYAHLSYMTAYVKLHYPASFMCAALIHADSKRTAQLLSECLRMGILILPPDINRSERTFSVCSDRQIRYGLTEIRGVGNAADAIITERENNGSFRSVKDFLLRVHQDCKVTNALIEAGALDRWHNNRHVLKTAYLPVVEDIRQYRYYQQAIETETGRKKERLKEKMEFYRERYLSAVFPTGTPESKEEKLREEKERLGLYVSGHPLDRYSQAIHTIRSQSKQIADYATGQVQLCGIISGITIQRRRTDGKAFAMFRLVGYASEIETVCFTEPYAKYAGILTEGAAVIVTGKIKSEDKQKAQYEKQLILDQVQLLKPNTSLFLMSVPSIILWPEILRQIQRYEQAEGNELYIQDRTTGSVWKAPFEVSEKLQCFFRAEISISVFEKPLECKKSITLLEQAA